MAFTFAGQYTEAILATGSSGATLLPALTTHVYTVGTTTHVTLYTSRTKGTTTGNPVTTDVNGNLTFFVDPGQYDLVFTPPGGSLKRITVTVPQDPAEDSATYATVGALAPKPPIRPKLTYLTTFKSGHGWTLTATGGTAADDTVNFEYGDRSVKGVTNGTGGNFSADKSALPAMDLTNRTLAFRVRVDDWTKVDLTSGIICYLGDDSLTNYVIVSMVLGKAPGSTSISYPTPANEWAWLYVDANEGIIGSGGTGAAILSNVTHVLFRAIDQATGPVTVNLGAVAYYTRQNVFPNGVLTLWFDDSYGSQYTLARQVCDTYGFGFQLSTIIDSVDTAGQLTLAQLHDLEDNHGCEVSAHAYYGANHNAGFTTLSQADLDTDLRLSKEWLTAERFRGSDFMSFPLGDENAAVRDRVRRYFSHSRHVDGRLPKLNIDQPLRFGARIVNATTPTATLTGYIDSAVSGSYSTSRWLHLVFHKILASGSTASTEYDQANFQTVIDYAATKGIPVMTMSDVLRKL